MPRTTTHSFQFQLHQLQHQSVRDLAWCCFSAPLMRELPESDAAILPFDEIQLWPWLIALDKEPQALIEHLHQTKSTRLGIYYEALWHFYFSQQGDWELLHHNLQIERNGITLGAFDFLCRRGSEYWHIETAVKFYLCNAQNADEASAWHHWIGPNSEDRLDLKLGHLRQHQLPLHKTPEAQKKLQALYPDIQEWKTGLCIQGYLFSPMLTDFHPAYSTASHGKGHWWYLRDFLHYQHQQTDTYWIILDRQHWLAPAQLQEDEALKSNSDLLTQLHHKLYEIKRPLLLAALKKMNANDQYLQETWRGFIVPDNWPDNR